MSRLVSSPHPTNNEPPHPTNNELQVYIKTGWKSYDTSWENSHLLGKNEGEVNSNTEVVEGGEAKREAGDEAKTQAGDDAKTEAPAAEPRDEAKMEAPAAEVQAEQKVQPPQRSKGSYATARLRKFASVVESGTLPVEDVGTLHSFHGLMEMVEGCKSMATEAELLKLADTVESQTQQVNQLLNCMKTAVKDSSITLSI